MSGLRFEVTGAIARLTLDRPDSGNALDAEMAHGILAAANHCNGDPAIRAVLLTGAGRLFCGGGDIASFAAAGDQLPRFLRDLTAVIHPGISRLLRMEKPLVTAINGPAAGAGLSLALLGDIVIASERAHFSVGYPGVGMAPDVGASFLLPRLVGLRRAQEMFLLNERISATRALEIGLVTRVVADDALPAATEEILQKLASGPTRAFSRCRRLLLESFSATLESQLEQEARSIADCGAEPDGREGIAAFLAKRPPAFTGRN